MAPALAPRRMLLWLLVAAAALLFAGAGHAAAAQRSPVAHPTTGHHRVVAYADGTLTVSGHGRHRRPVAHGRVRTMAATPSHRPVAYADGTLTAARHHAHHRRTVRRIA